MSTIKTIIQNRNARSLKEAHEQFIKKLLPEFFTKEFLKENKRAVLNDLASRSSNAIEDHIMFHALKDVSGIINTRFKNGYSDAIFINGLSENLRYTIEAFKQPVSSSQELKERLKTVVKNITDEIIGLSSSKHR